MKTLRRLCEARKQIKSRGSMFTFTVSVLRYPNILFQLHITILDHTEGYLGKVCPAIQNVEFRLLIATRIVSYSLEYIPLTLPYRRTNCGGCGSLTRSSIFPDALLALSTSFLASGTTSSKSAQVGLEDTVRLRRGAAGSN